ncbi:hypothetical protein LAZ67_7002224 [Cordylochernes scorpioides]|uniref:Transposase Tc1-like domain-containing protein n=1 Tax=Cordylochernes scorpioides TaxID=51811 RepID=A0ABY6KNF5_9ARAC|nr:hypothetical protein LAZ67_7002224 [Cordylochernes scorpioides]
MPRRKIRAHYEHMSEFETGRAIGLKEAGDVGKIRLQWCRERSTWNCADWGRIVFSDESRFLLCPDDRRKHVWRRPGQRVDPSLTVEHHTGPQQGDMVWGAISFESRNPLVVIPGTLTTQRSEVKSTEGRGIQRVIHPGDPYSQVNPRMEEGEIVAHILKGILEDTYQVLVAKDIQTVDEILKFCHHLATIMQRRIGRKKFASGPLHKHHARYSRTLYQATHHRPHRQLLRNEHLSPSARTSRQNRNAPLTSTDAVSPQPHKKAGSSGISHYNHFLGLEMRRVQEDPSWSGGGPYQDGHDNHGHRKRRQFKQTDAFTRGMVIGLKRAGWSMRQIAADTHLGASTVHRLWRRWLEQGNVAINRNVGATRMTSARVDQRILRQAVAAPQATCTAILQHVQDTLDHSISTRTISRRLVANGLHSCRPLRRLPLTPPNRRQRLEWCRARSTWMTEWHRVVFSDSRVSACPVIVAVYACGVDVEKGPIRQQLSPLLRIQGTMTAQRYVDDVLRPVTLPYLQGVPNALYQQDNARPHTARISQQALQDVQMLPWPPYFPDLSPIEHVWDSLDAVCMPCHSRVQKTNCGKWLRGNGEPSLRTPSVL